MALILTRADLVELTGYRRPSRQIRWLRDYGIRHFVGADGHPRVLAKDLESEQSPGRKAVPDLSWLRQPR